MEVWKLARELTRDVYRLSGKGLFAKDYGLRDQIRRATVSIMSNVAEGYERSGTKEFVQFLATAKGSAAEVSTYFYVALDQGYIDEKTMKLPAASGGVSTAKTSPLPSPLHILPPQVGEDRGGGDGLKGRGRGGG